MPSGPGLQFLYHLMKERWLTAALSTLSKSLANNLSAHYSSLPQYPTIIFKWCMQRMCGCAWVRWSMCTAVFVFFLWLLLALTAWACACSGLQCCVPQRPCASRSYRFVSVFVHVCLSAHTHRLSVLPSGPPLCRFNRFLFKTDRQGSQCAKLACSLG